jgi:quercetin dioxygenase-like cupin family protein
MENSMNQFKNPLQAAQFTVEKMKKNSLFESARCFCDLYCFEPGQTQSPHTHHGSDKIYYVIKGRGVFQVGEEEKELGEGELAIAESGQRHGVSNRGNERLTVLVFMAPKPSH